MNEGIDDILIGIKNQNGKNVDDILVELVKWLDNERFTTEDEEQGSDKERAWKLSRNATIDRTIAKIVELVFK